MNVEKFLWDVKVWTEQNNQQATALGFGSDGYWNWVVESSGKLCDYYKNDPLAINVMLGMWNYLLEIFGGRK